MEVSWVNNMCDLTAEATISICFQVSIVFFKHYFSVLLTYSKTSTFYFIVLF